MAKVIETVCRTGGKGDGRIFVTDVVGAIRIRDGLRGEVALQVPVPHCRRSGTDADCILDAARYQAVLNYRIWPKGRLAAVTH